MADEREIESQEIFEDIRDYARQLESDNAQRNADYAEYEQMYLMNWEKGRQDSRLAGMRVTEDPDARNAVDGMTRLMIANNPVWKIDDDTANAEQIEEAITSWWNESGRAARQPHEYDLVRSGMLYGAMEAAINPTQELLERARKTSSKGTIAAAEKLAERTPFLIDVWNPRSGFPAYDIFGLAAYYRKVDMKAADAQSRFGKLPDEIANKGKWKNVTIHQFYDRDWYAVWVNNSTPLTVKKHELPVMPIMSQIIDGSMLFDKPEYQRQPPLYALLRSGLWDAQCLWLTVAFTAIFAMGTVGKWLHVAPADTPGKKLEIDWQSFVIEMEAGEQLQPLLTKGLLDPDAAKMYELATAKIEQSTIYKQALGSALNRQTTFGETTTLALAGRLPLIASQRKGGWGMAEIAEKMLAWGKAKGAYLKGSDLKAGAIPKNPAVTCSLEIQLAQDKLQMANIARMLTNGDDPLTSKTWTLQNILGISQPNKMTTQIWDERAGQLMYMQEVQRLMQEAQAAAAQAQQAGSQFPGAGMPPGAAGAGGPQLPPGGPPQPPSAGAMMPPGQAEMMQGMPPQMAGQLPGMSQAVVPPAMEGGMNGEQA